MRRNDAVDPAPVDPAPVDPAPVDPAPAPEAGPDEPEELLVEEISIDGMCGVY